MSSANKIGLHYAVSASYDFVGKIERVLKLPKAFLFVFQLQVGAEISGFSGFSGFSFSYNLHVHCFFHIFYCKKKPF